MKKRVCILNYLQRLAMMGIFMQSKKYQIMIKQAV